MKNEVQHNLEKELEHERMWAELEVGTNLVKLPCMRG